MSHVSEKFLKAWLNYNCSQGNNWITLCKFEEMISHPTKKYYETSETKLLEKNQDEFVFNAKDLRHIYFTYMTDSQLITLVENVQGEYYLINNKLTAKDDETE